MDINDFSRASEKLFSVLYAGGTSVFIEGYEYDKVIASMNNEMKKVDIWLSIKRKLITWSFIEPELKQDQRNRY